MVYVRAKWLSSYATFLNCGNAHLMAKLVKLFICYTNNSSSHLKLVHCQLLKDRQKIGTSSGGILTPLFKVLFAS